MSERVYTHNGHTFPISWPDKPDWVMAGLVRMLMRDQLNHEAICVGARDRILCLSQEADTLRAENERLRAALFEELDHIRHDVRWADGGRELERAMAREQAVEAALAEAQP